MAYPVHRERAAPRRGAFGIFALLATIVVGFLTVSLLNARPAAREYAASLDELDDVDFDNAEEATAFLKSKVRASTGSEYL